jgi:hypothetical protein
MFFLLKLAKALEPTFLLMTYGMRTLKQRPTHGKEVRVVTGPMVKIGPQVSFPQAQ